MIALLLALALPSLYWDKAPDTAGQLKQAKITQLTVPASLDKAWKSQPGFNVQAGDPAGAVKLDTPKVQFRINRASATRSPWIDVNGWAILRQPSGQFYYEAPGPSAALAAAEAYMYGGNAMVHTDEAGLKPLGEMLAFLGGLKEAGGAPVADIGFVDDSSDEAAEVMKLMIRRNLLFNVVKSPDPALPVNVQLGSKEYTREEAADPSELAQKIRTNLTDEKRHLRIYGSQIVIGRLTGSEGKVRVHLLNYTGPTRDVDGIRVRVLGRYPKHDLHVSGIPEAALVDFDVSNEATEFTLPNLKTYAVIDLSR